MRNILLIQGHPDLAGGHLCHLLADAYLEAARAAGHQTDIVTPATLDFPLLANAREWEEGEVAPAHAAAGRQGNVRRAPPQSGKARSAMTLFITSVEVSRCTPGSLESLSSYSCWNDGKSRVAMRSR